MTNVNNEILKNTSRQNQFNDAFRKRIFLHRQLVFYFYAWYSTRFFNEYYIFERNYCIYKFSHSIFNRISQNNIKGLNIFQFNIEVNIFLVKLTILNFSTCSILIFDIGYNLVVRNFMILQNEKIVLSKTLLLKITFFKFLYSIRVCITHDNVLGTKEIIYILHKSFVIL